MAPFAPPINAPCKRKKQEKTRRKDNREKRGESKYTLSMINHIHAKCFLPHPLLHKSAHELDGFGSSANSPHHTFRFNPNLIAVQTQNTATP